MSETLAELEVTIETRSKAANKLLFKALGEYSGRGLLSSDEVADRLLDVTNILSGVTSDFEVLELVTEPS